MDYSYAKHKINGGIGADDQFWQGLEHNEFRLSRCNSCKNWTWPAHYRCGNCGGWEMEWVALPPEGTIYTWTRSWYAFDRVKERAVDVPYVTVVVEIPAAAGARVMGILEGSEQGLKIGAPVRGLIKPPSEKTKHYPSIVWQIQQ